MTSMLAFLLSLALQATPPPDATYVTSEEAAATLKESIAKGTIDQPLKATEVLGGKASVAMLHRKAAETNALSHDRVTETYYILEGSGTFTTGGTLNNPTATDLARVNAGMSQTGPQQGGQSRRLKPGDIVIIPAGTPHRFSQLDGPISYLVYRFEPMAVAPAK